VASLQNCFCTPGPLGVKNDLTVGYFGFVGKCKPYFLEAFCYCVASLRRYVGNIHTKVTEGPLAEVFSNVGPLEGCKLIRKEKVMVIFCGVLLSSLFIHLLRIFWVRICDASNSLD